MKSGLVAIVGRPSVGKSTLLNALCGEKVAIASPVPQTTRNAIRGIVNRSQGQIVFLDTPGYHISDKKFNSYLKDVVKRSMANADIILHVVMPPSAGAGGAGCRSHAGKGQSAGCGGRKQN